MDGQIRFLGSIIVHLSTEAMALFARWIVVDDTSPEVNYIGDSWFSENGNPISTQDTGSPYKNTLHGTNANASLTFNFTGSSVRVKGTIQTPNVSSVDNPTWVCSVDGVQTGSSMSRRPLLPTTSNDWIYCQSLKLEDGPHILTLNATGTEKTFWFDRIEYVPSASVPLDDKTISLSSSTDKDIHFSAGWTFGQTSAQTSQSGAHMTLYFVGTMVTWWTQYTSEGNSTTASWTIDDNPAQNATLPDHKPGDPHLFNQKVFDTGPLSMGDHRLTVTYNGNAKGSNTPLVLSSIFIENGTFPSKTVDPTGPTTTSSSETSRPTTSKMTPLVIGGVVGVVAILLLIFVVFLFAFYRHRRELAKMGVEKFETAPRHAQHGDRKLRNFERDTNSLDSGSSSGNVLRSQPLPRKILDDLAGYAPLPPAQMPQTVALYQPLPRKFLENSDAMMRGLDQTMRGVAPQPIGPSIGPSKGTVVVHHDSGVRMNNQVPEASVRETPPEYN